MNARASLSLLLRVALAGAAVALAACTNFQQVKVPEVVKVPTPVPCVDPAKVPAKPEFRSAEHLLALDLYRRTLATWSELEKRAIYSAQLDAIVAGCARLNTP